MREDPFRLPLEYGVGAHPIEPDVLDLGSTRVREKKVLNRGRKQAMEEAVIPMPGSTVDQIETSTLA